jgi:hypothetical protein
MRRIDLTGKPRRVGRACRISACIAMILICIGLSSCSNPNITEYKPSKKVFADAAGKPFVTVGNLGLKPIFASFGSPIMKLQSKYDLIVKMKDDWIKKGGDAAKLQNLMSEMSHDADAANYSDAVIVADKILSMMGASSNMINSAYIDSHCQERDGLLADLKKLGANGLEDYIGWIAVEPSKGNYNWDVYKEDAQAVKNSGYSFIAFLWIQTLPEWVKKDPEYVMASNVETGKSTQMLSIFAQSTLDAYDRFYGEASRQLGSMIDVLRIGTPYDFGETAYPASAAVSNMFPVANLQPGLWVNEAPAREAFKSAMKAKYQTIQKLNDAWGTAFTSFDLLDYPKDNKQARYWIDFIAWYHEGLTTQIGMIADIARKYFPQTPINLNIGWPYEKICLGQDISGIMKMGSEKQLCMRTPTGPNVPFLYTKRVATAARWYPPLRFSSEPVDGNATAEQSAQSYFKDLTTGVNWHFDYPPNCLLANTQFNEYLSTWQGGEYPTIDTALFYPTSTQYLENWNNWQGEGFTGGNPAGLAEYAEGLRDAIDYDVIDERIAQDGYLKAYKYLLWPVGTTVEADTLNAIAKWVKDGGTLLVNAIDKIKTVGGDSGAFGEITKLAATNGIRKYGSGSVIDISGDVAEMLGKYPGKADAMDGVLMSRFTKGILVFNRTTETITKTVQTGNGAVEALAPSQFKWIAQ